jgi:hypothetical protein
MKRGYSTAAEAAATVTLRSELDRARPNAQLFAEGVDDRGIELRTAATLELFESLTR